MNWDFYFKGGVLSLSVPTPPTPTLSTTPTPTFQDVSVQTDALPSHVDQMIPHSPPSPQQLPPLLPGCPERPERDGTTMLSQLSQLSQGSWADTRDTSMDFFLHEEFDNVLLNGLDGLDDDLELCPSGNHVTEEWNGVLFHVSENKEPFEFEKASALGFKFTSGFEAVPTFNQQGQFCLQIQKSFDIYDQFSPCIQLLVPAIGGLSKWQLSALLLALTYAKLRSGFKTSVHSSMVCLETPDIDAASVTKNRQLQNESQKYADQLFYMYCQTLRIE